MTYNHKNIVILFISLIFLFAGTDLRAQQNGGQELDVDEVAAKEAERLGELLEMEYWQIFYADSILRHDYGCLNQEILQMRKDRISQNELYQRVQDKWTEKADNALKKILTPEQWNKYLKDGAGRRIREREKRKKGRY